MRLLLDTATFLFAIESSHRISRRAMSHLQDPANTREISVASLAEVALKCAIGKLALTEADVLKGIADLELRVLSCNSDHAFEVFRLPLHHRDPFDREIIAQALVEDIPVVTPDRQFESYKGLKVIW
jgi:PIN domain nuclease of toxin-antitoxin system